MAEARKRYILLRDCVGHIQERSMLSLGRSVSTPTHLLKGELLEALPETEQPNDSTRIALAGIERKNLRLECDMEGIAKLTSEDANLLLAISSAGSRYQTYIDRKRLDFGRQIKHGSQVFVELKGVSKKLHGIVWYVGELPTNLGTMFGIELLKNPGQGTSDGTFRNKRYFTCAQDSGVFVAFDKLTPYEDTNSSSPKSQKRGESNQGNFTSKIKDAVLASFFKGSKSDQKSPRKRADYDLKIDQRVVTFVGDVPVRGNVRYIAEEKDSHGQLIVGLELDERIGSGCGRLKGKQIFIARRDFAAFVDIETVIPERDFDQTVSKLKNEGDVLDQVKRDERLARSLSHNPGCRASGGESVRKMRRTHSFESPDHEVIVAAGESSQTDCAAFIETQQKLLHECKSAKNYAPEDPDVVMSDDERTDSAGNIYFRDDHYSNSRQNSVPKISMPITKQPDLSGTKDYSDYVQIRHEDYKKQIQEHQKDRFEPVSPMETDHKVASKDYNPTGGNNIENALSTERGKNLQENAALCGDEQTSHKTTDLEAHSNVDNPYGFEVDSVVEVPMAQERPRYGVIRWIGTLSAVKGKLVAGLELDDEQSACSDGTFDGERYFTCPAGRGFFILLKHCRQDSRFTANSPISDHDYQSSKAFGSLPSEEVEGVTVPPTSLVDKFCGEMRGLQGHHNSCYLDATLYAMFAFSSVFDTLLHREQKDSDLKEYGEVQLVLREAIVNPLRTNGFVRADRILKLRKLLDELSSTAGLVNEEKDPEEFLNSLLKQVLKADPFLHLKSRDERKKDSEGAFFYQIITEKDEAVKIPRVQQLLEQSFLSADIILSEVSSVKL